MIILDTNVVSEALRPEPAPAVLDWLDAWQSAELFTTAITEAELWYGIERLPLGERRSRVAEAVGAILDVDFAGRVLPFESSCARSFGRIAAARRREGRPISVQDALIAAIAATFGAAVATRNTADFEGCGIELVNPWEG